MSRVVFKGKIVSDFNGFKDKAVFKMSNGTYWVQAQYCYWYHYAYRPDAVVIEENGSYILTVAEQSIPVRLINDVIESNIDGVFTGWDGSKRYKLTNGQVWQQSEYKYEYTYAYRPEAMICNINGSYIMFVQGTQAAVRKA